MTTQISDPRTNMSEWQQENYPQDDYSGDFYYEMPDDDFGVYNSRGEQIGSTCSCEDYPCCGHGGE